MAVREVIKMGHPTLRKKAKELTKEEILSSETKELVSDMFETMEAYDGIGIAAPQVGVSKSIAIVGVESENDRYPDAPKVESYVVINPKITILDESLQGMWEGCLSVPGLRGYVERPSKVRIDFLDLNASEQTLETEGFLAIVFQHELDHLFGRIYVDRIKDMTKLVYNDVFEQFYVEDSDAEDDD